MHFLTRNVEISFFLAVAFFAFLVFRNFVNSAGQKVFISFRTISISASVTGPIGLALKELDLLIPVG